MKRIIPVLNRFNGTGVGIGDMFRINMLFRLFPALAGLLFFGAGALAAQGSEQVTVSTVAELENAVQYANSRNNVEIILKNGVYWLSDALAIWGDGITVRGESGNRDAVLIYGQGMAGGASHIFNVPGSRFTARDMTIGRVANHAVQIWGNNNAGDTVLYNLHIVDTGEQMVKISYDASSPNRSANGRLEKCLLEYTAGKGPQYYIGGIDGHYCRNWTVRGNTFKNIASPSDSLAEHAVHFWSGSEHTLVENNIIINCDRGIGFGLGERGHVGGIIRNNFIYHSSGVNTDFADVGIGLENASGVLVYNNTVFFENDYPNAVEYRFSGTRGGIIYNNLTNRGIVSRDGGSAAVGFNVTGALASWFRSSASGDLHLATPVVQVVDKGTVISGLNADIDGDQRPQGSGIDIGADEYRTVAPLTAKIKLSRAAFYFGGSGALVSGAQSFLISNSGSGAMNWTVSRSASWLGCSPASGVNKGVVTLSVNPVGLGVGNYSAVAAIRSAQAVNSPQTVVVYLRLMGVAQERPPFGSLDSPANGAVVAGNVAVTGWALDDTAVSAVRIFRYPIAGEGLNPVYIGAAVFVEGARPDVETAYPGYPANYKAGWGYMMLTNLLPAQGNGRFSFYAEAEDKTGKRTILGDSSVFCRNASSTKPFGAIETPDQGGTASGSRYRNWGWALTPPPHFIPYSGATISVTVDGKNLGRPVYGLYRADVAALFPGFANKDGAFGYFDLDTSGYADGVHTIQWVVTDSAGHTDGIGSRYFNIRNGGSRESKNKAGSTGVNSRSGGVPVFSVSGVPAPGGKAGKNKKGVVSYVVDGRAGGEAERGMEVRPEKGRIRIRMGRDARLTVFLGEPVFGVYPQAPVGASLDEDAGIFRWQPGPVFSGTFFFSFACVQRQGMIKIAVTIKGRHE